jgi:hypothetical protein
VVVVESEDKAFDVSDTEDSIPAAAEAFEKQGVVREMSVQGDMFRDTAGHWESTEDVQQVAQSIVAHHL